MINSKELAKTRYSMRKNIICYFLAMASGHKATQQLQQQLIMHPYFNPLLLFKKISKERQFIQCSDFINYLLMQAEVYSLPGIQIFMKKHKLNKNINCEQFIQSMLPYTPDILRNSNATIVWQIKSSPNFNQQVQMVYKQILKTEIYHILNISSFRKKIQANWKQFKQFILQDLKRSTNFSSNTFDVVIIRRWMELWIEIDEKDVLNIMRWIGGGAQQNLYDHFNQFFVTDVLCTCQHTFLAHPIQIKQQQQRKIDDFRYSMRPLSRKETLMCERKITYLSNKQLIPPVSSRKSTVKITRSDKSRSIKDVATGINKEKKYEKNSKIEKSIELWCQYLYTILTGQKALSQKREKVKSNITRVIQILKQTLLSKKNGITRLTKIIKFIQKYTKISHSSLKLMYDKLQNLSIENNVIVSIFNYEIANSKANTGTNSQIHPNNNVQMCQISDKQLKIQIADSLKNYCLTKCKLIKISQQMIKSNLHDTLFKVLDPQDTNNINKQNLTQIIKQMQIQYKQENIHTLMRHFGDGNVITYASFMRVFQIQGE